MKIPILPFVVLFVVWMTLKLKSVTHKAKQNTEHFWEKENRANQTRKKSLDELPYIQLPLERFPILDTSDEDLLAHQKTIESLSHKKILNLTGLTNTELKLKYGAPNLTELIQCDQDFTRLARELFLWGRTLSQKGYKREAKTVLEFGVACRTDISGHYTLLATLYKEDGEEHKIDTLIEAAQSLSGIMKPSILKSLQDISAS